MASLLAATLVSCDVAQQPCPEVDTGDLLCPVEIGPFEVGACSQLQNYDMPGVGLAVSAGADGPHVEMTEVLFRDDNEICGFAEVEDGDLRVLLQPCVLVPEGGVSKGDCWYEIAFDIDEVDTTGAETITVFQRVDRPPEFEPYTPEEIASAVLE